MNYNEFLDSKKHTLPGCGFDPVFYPDIAFDFQKEIICRATQKGRMAIFADTGLGKTLMQISIAQNFVQYTNKKVLILTPLAVAFQFIDEAAKLGVDDIEYSKDGKHSKKIVVSNYERLHYFDSSDFVGVILDESSILKNFKGQIKTQVTAFCKKIKYRVLSTATPSPNDFIELGTSSEVLGYMGYMDMLGKFFKSNQGSVDSRNGDKFYLKPHAEKDFFAWVNQWSIMIKKPSDIGPFNDDKYNLPDLIKNVHTVKNNRTVSVDGQIQMFNIEAKNFHEIRNEQKQTIKERCEKAIQLSHDTSVYWVNLNEESKFIKNNDAEVKEIIGSMSLDQKEDILVNFAKGNIKKIVTKAKMTGMGLNWQHCNHCTFFPTYSFEQYYQAIRRFWRFGQKSNVTVDLVVSDGQKKILKTLDLKTKKAQDLYQNLVDNTQDININTLQFSNKIIKPNF